MRVVYSNIDCKTAISKSSLPGLDYSLNPYFGCEHCCRYCYSPSVFRGSIAPSSWGSFVKIKKNILEVLRNDLKKKIEGVIGLSTVTDPYQPIEKQSKLTRDCIKLISGSKFKLSIQTKSILFLRDIEVMERNKTDIGITITTLDNNLAHILEPNSSAPYERMSAIAKAASKGFNSWIFLGPIIPRVNDDIDRIDEILKFARKNGVRMAISGTLLVERMLT